MLQVQQVVDSRWPVSVAGALTMCLLLLRLLLLCLLRPLLQGDWVSNVMHGQGSFRDTEGHCWAGQFYNGAGPGLTCQL
jgi:hypothetical protein